MEETAAAAAAAALDEYARAAEGQRPKMHAKSRNNGKLTTGGAPPQELRDDSSSSGLEYSTDPDHSDLEASFDEGEVDNETTLNEGLPANNTPNLNDDSSEDDDPNPATPTPPLNFPAEMCCPITSEVMEDPVLTEDGQCYERAAISAWLATHNTSPITGARMSRTKMITNYHLKSSTLHKESTFIQRFLLLTHHPL